MAGEIVKAKIQPKTNEQTKERYSQDPMTSC